MPKITRNPTKEITDLQVALNTAPDYSNTFTRQVTSLQGMLTDELAGPVEHDDDMNYSSAQKLVVWLDKECRLLTPRAPEAVYQLIDFVSSRGRVFAFLTLGLSASTAGWKEKGLEKPMRYWSRMAEDKLPGKVKNLEKRIALLMKANGYTMLEDSVLSQAAEGHWTQLDGQPATVFETLFSEMY